MNIGTVAARSGVPPKTIRYHEDIRLIQPARGFSGYRAFSPKDAHKLAFLGRARSLGFSIEDRRALLSLYEDRGRASADVKEIAAGHVARIDVKIAELEAMRATLTALMARCHGDDGQTAPSSAIPRRAPRPTGQPDASSRFEAEEAGFGGSMAEAPSHRADHIASPAAFFL